MRFTKSQSLGNDYAVLDAFRDDVPGDRAALADLARTLCDRHFGVGADGLILLQPAADAHAHMTIINADGSPGGMCGNGLRCAAKLLVERDHATPDDHSRITIRLDERLIPINVHLADDLTVEAATVDLGAPVLEPDLIPIDNAALSHPDANRPHTFALDGVPFVPVSMGNPHAVVFTDDPEKGLFTIGPAWERHPAFPQRTNVHFLRVGSRDDATLLSWERGVGHTLACGTGAAAAAVAGVLTDRLDRHPVVRMPGGDVIVRWDESTNHVFLTGPATTVFEGDFP